MVKMGVYESFWLEKCQEGSQFEEIGIGGKTMLNTSNIRKWEVKVGIRFNWLRYAFQHNLSEVNEAKR
jgi:hypothetical protein